jgi:hypothetical protein
MILAIVVFATAHGPAGTWAGRTYFRTQAECEQFIAANAALIDIQRQALEAQRGQPVRAITDCIDAGRDA